MRSPDFKWKKRPLLIFASDHRDPDLLQTRCAIQRRSFDLEQRDIIVGNFLAKGLSSLDGQDISALVASNFRQLFDIDNARFALLLIGKDGGEKLRSGESPDLDTIFSLIDGMPV